MRIEIPERLSDEAVILRPGSCVQVHRTQGRDTGTRTAQKRHPCWRPTTKRPRAAASDAKSNHSAMAREATTPSRIRPTTANRKGVKLLNACVESDAPPGISVDNLGRRGRGPQ